MSLRITTPQGQPVCILFRQDSLFKTVDCPRNRDGEGCRVQAEFLHEPLEIDPVTEILYIEITKHGGHECHMTSELSQPRMFSLFDLEPVVTGIVAVETSDILKMRKICGLSIFGKHRSVQSPFTCGPQRRRGPSLLPNLEKGFVFEKCLYRGIGRFQKPPGVVYRDLPCTAHRNCLQVLGPHDCAGACTAGARRAVRAWRGISHEVFTRDGGAQYTNFSFVTLDQFLPDRSHRFACFFSPDMRGVPECNGSCHR